MLRRQGAMPTRTTAQHTSGSNADPSSKHIKETEPFGGYVLAKTLAVY